MWVAIAATLCSSSALAQKVELPKAGSFGTEVQFNPFDQNGEQFKLDGLKLRYFISNKDALRLKIGLGINSSENAGQITEPNDKDAANYDFQKALYNYACDNQSDKSKSGSFSLDLGYERHFYQKGRLDLYAGAQIGIGFGWANRNEITPMYKIKDGATDLNLASSYTFYTEEKETTGGNDAYFAVGASVFTGLDFYVYKGLYIGTELGLYINHKSFKDTEITEIDNNPSATTKNAKVTTTKTNLNNNTSVKFNVEPTIRLGWTF